MTTSHFLRATSLVFVIILWSLSAAAGVGDWKSFTAKRDLRGLVLRDSTIWAVTGGGMFSARISHTFQEFTTSEGLKTIDLTAIALDNSGNLWIGAQNGFLHRYDPARNEWRYISDISINTDPSKRINSLDVVGDTLFICSDIGLSLFSISRMEFGDTYERFGDPGNQIVGRVTSVQIFKGRLWVGTRNGLASTSMSNPNPSAPESWQVYTTAQGLSSNIITGLTIMDTTLAASTASGLNFFNGTGWNLLAQTAGLNILGLTDTTVSCTRALYFITQREIWNYNGITVSKIDSLIPFNLTTISSGGLIGSQTQGAVVFDYCPTVGLPRILDTLSPPGPASNKFVGIAVDMHGVVWSGTGISNGEGFMSFDGQTWKSYTSSTDSRLRNNNFYRVNIGKDNSKWVSSWGDGVALLDDAGTLQKVFNTTNGLSPSIDPTFVVVGGVATDVNGTAWIADRTPRGDTVIATFAPDSSFGYTRGIVTRANPVTVMADVVIDQLGTKWFANFSRYEGVFPYALFFYNESRALPGTTNGWGKLTLSDGLATNKVYSLAVGREGEMWIGSDAGISIIFDPSRPDLVAQYHPPSVQDQIIQCIVVDPLNNKWLGTKQGVFVLSSDGTSLLSRYTVENTDGKLLDNDIASMAIDGKTGTMYFGTEKGLSSLGTAGAEPQRSFSDLILSPNPMLVPSTSLTIDGLIENSLIKIISPEGSVIAEIQSPGGRVAFWDGKNNRGEYVGTGVYIVVAYSGDGTKVAKGKVAVVRK